MVATGAGQVGLVVCAPRASDGSARGPPFGRIAPGPRGRLASYTTLGWRRPPAQVTTKIHPSRRSE